MSSNRVIWLLLAILCLVVTAVYWSGLAGNFVFDDFSSIVNNPSLRLFDGTFASLVDASTGGITSPLGRPLSLASFAANYYFWGEAPFHFKLVNLLIHLANGLLVYWLVRQLWPRLIGDDRSGMGAFWIAALWLLHPINLTPVLFVVQRMTSLSAFFTLGALCLYLLGRQLTGRRRWLAYALSLLVCWPAGILAKETALLLPLFILLIEWLVLGGFRNIPTRYQGLGLAVLVGGALTMLATAWSLIERTYLLRDFTLQQRLLTEARVLWLYVGQMLAPWPDIFSLHHDDITISRGVLNPPVTALAIAGWVATIGAALWQRRHRPWLTFAVLWFLVGHALESSMLGLEIAYEHRNYLPSLGIFIGLSVLLLPRPTTRIWKAPRIVLAFGFVALCGLVTGLRATQWGDEYVRTQIESNTHPQSARTHHEAARAILERQLPTGEITYPAYHMARIHFQRAAQYDPRNKAALAGILFLDCAVRVKPDEEIRLALLERLAHVAFTLEDQWFIQSLSDQLIYNLLCLDVVQVETLLTAALSNPTATGVIRGMLYALSMDYAAVRLGSLPQARMHAMAAIQSDPGNAVLRINLIRVLLQLGETNEARRQYAALTKLQIPLANRKEVENLGLGLGN